MKALEQIREWPALSPSAGVTSASATIAQAGDVDLDQPWASVTKLVTAYGALRLLEVGELDLDEPAGPEGSTVRHLLAHTSGLNFEGNATLSAPGRRRVYSNGGFEVLGRLMEQRAGQPVGAYLREAVLEPLGMTASTIAGSPAKDGHGPVRDLLLLARELLAPTLVGRETLARATSVISPGLDGVLPGYGRQTPNDWGLGFEIRDGKSPHWTGRRNSPGTFGHFGQQGSFVWVDPAIATACVVLTSTPFGPWAVTAWPAFSDAVIAEISHPHAL